MPDRLDWAVISGFLGVRRIRPRADLTLGIKSGASLSGSQHFDLCGNPTDDLRQLLLREFSPETDVSIKRREMGTRLVYSLDWGNRVGRGTSRDVVLGELFRKAIRRHRLAADERTKGAIVCGVEVPTRMGIYDLFLHEDAIPDWIPNARILSTGERGSADPNDESRAVDVLDLLSDISSLGTGVRHFRAEEIPRYVELLDRTCRQLG